MEFLELAKARYSVRSFKADKLPADVVNKIVEAGCVAPTACNRQPLKIIAVTGEEGMEKFRRCTECHYGAPMGFIVCSDLDTAWQRPFDGKKSSDVDASIAATHMMLEAADLGVGSVWVMFFKPDAVREEFSLPDNLEPVALLPMGYPADGSKPSAQHTQFKPLDEMVSYE